jgi:hypothetical protein
MNLHVFLLFTGFLLCVKNGMNGKLQIAVVICLDRLDIFYECGI